jgi:Tfp pilus assembly protein FimT
MIEMTHSSIANKTPQTGSTRYERGFTLIEILAILAILTAVMLISVPAMQRTRVKANAMNQLRGITSCADLARFEALKRGEPTCLSINAAGGVITVFEDWSATGTGNNNKQYDAGEEVLRTFELDDLMKIDSVSFGGGDTVQWAVGGNFSASTAEVFLSDVSGNSFKITLNALSGAPRVWKYEGSSSPNWKANERQWIWSF